MPSCKLPAPEPINVFLDPVGLPVEAFAPIATLSAPVVIPLPANVPIATFVPPVVTAFKDSKPTPTLFVAVLFVAVLLPNPDLKPK